MPCTMGPSIVLKAYRQSKADRPCRVLACDAAAPLSPSLPLLVSNLHHHTDGSGISAAEKYIKHGISLRVLTAVMGPQ